MVIGDQPAWAPHLRSTRQLRSSAKRRSWFAIQTATSLSKFRDVVDIERRGEPAVLGVITATGHGYVRDDGIG